MDWHRWLAFVAASTVMGLAPGPAVTSIIGYALSSGRRTALASVAGMATGNLVAMSLSLAGVGALLAASALAFSILKWVGAAYLIGSGILTLLRSRERPGLAVAPAPIAARTAFASNVAVGTFHPKTIVFFVAFVPQFIDPRHGYGAQAVLLAATFALVVGTTDTAYAFAASRASRLLRTPRAAAWMRRAGGGALIAAGALTALART
ncbi:MAG: LysE family translocator [Gammaproteobacteria bacterium]|nr:LysE family translocator [Gammaproteobacteria bacterium]